jgi:hypothetical protein
MSIDAKTRFLIILDKFRGKSYGKTVLPPLRHATTGVDGGMLFRPEIIPKQISFVGGNLSRNPSRLSRFTLDFGGCWELESCLDFRCNPMQY